MNEYDWYRLDNAAKIFPAISGSHTSNVFRLDVRLKDPVKPAFLNEAVNQTLPAYPAFQVQMRMGLFWYYFERNFQKSTVQEEVDYPCSRIDPDKNNGFLFRFCYYKNKISLDVFHVLSDGTAALNFLIDVVLCYMKISGEQPNGLFDLPEKRLEFPAMEDSFARYSAAGAGEAMKKMKAYHVRGTPRPKGNVKVISGILETEEFLKIVKSKKVTVTSYLTAVLAYSILQTKSGKNSPLPVRISIPINLRRFFESVTQRNFFAFIMVDIERNHKVLSFDELLKIVSEQMKERVNPEYFMPQLNYFQQAEKNILARVTPLFLKNLALRFIYSRMGDETYTLCLSNLGKIHVPPELEKQVEQFGFMLGISKKNHLNCGVCSFQDKLVVSFTKSDYETDVERNFFRFLTSEGLRVILEQNESGGTA